ncbi:MAG TPA: hypothetical protein VJH92_01030 [Candidatus Nanoarchaeia archaeon]|nr:hypothetical protein [Candidatus Nanoarchaeia archaeon]
MGEGLKALGFVSAWAALLLGIPYIINRGCNSQEINKPGYSAVSKPTGWVGHKEYIRYGNGAQEVVTYPSTGWTESRRLEDIDGDNSVDRIKINSSGAKSFRLDNVLIREHDYAANKEEFDGADKELREASAKYSSNRQ